METIVREECAPESMRASERFLRYLADWEAELRLKPLAEIILDAGGPSAVALHAIDLTVAFAESGRLASPRIGALVPPVVSLFRRAHEMGVGHFVLPQDAHTPHSPEFNDYGPHSIAGTEEARTIAALCGLPFSDRFVPIPKRSISTAVGTELESWLSAHPEVTHHIVVGDCTDICVYQHAMHLKMRSNALEIGHEVFVPEECVQTYDVPVEAAPVLGATPHDGDLLHLVFLYHMALNGVQVTRAVC